MDTHYGINSSLTYNIITTENSSHGILIPGPPGNGTMKDNSINSLCDGVSSNASVCNKKGLGISLSTPILMNTAGILGNLVALIVLLTARREMKRTMFYVLLSGLAGTDLLGQLLTGPIAIIVYANDLKWVGGDPLCQYHGFVMVCFGMITPLLVCCLSIERVIALRFPYFHERALTKRRVVIMILVCWGFVLAFCCLPFLGFGSYAHQFPGSWCFLNFHRESTSDEAYAYSYAFLNVIIIAIIILGNSCVMVTLVQMKRRKLNNTNSSPSTDRRNGSQRKSKLKLEEETQMIWFLFAITIVFTVCWFPLNIHILINQATGRINYAADLIGVRLASINVILDPWLYILLRKSVIVKAFKFVKNIFFKDGSQLSPKRSSRFVTNYSLNQVPKAMEYDKEVHELKSIDYELTQAKSIDKVNDKDNKNEREDVSSLESDTEVERRHLTNVELPHALSPESRHVIYNKQLSYDSCNATYKSQEELLGEDNSKSRKISLPANLFSR
ncbi:Prostaglandin E2 receptor EP4 subtype [Mactra antiquata]